jgi:structure-specific recognition protein 1
MFLAVPRGKYSVNFYEKMVRFHGSTFNFNIEYKHVVRCFLLPLPNEMLCLVLQLGKPVLLGKTANHFVLLQFKKEVRVEVKTRIKPENVKVNPALKEVKEDYEGEIHEVFPELIHGFVGVNILLPGPEIRTKEGHNCIKCNLKTHSGWLYFIRKSMLFVQKPTIYIRFEEITQIEFQRLNVTINKLFDMKVLLAKTDKKVAPPTFVGIEREHLEQLIEYFNANGVKVINKTEEKRVPYSKQDIDMDEESDDGSFQADPNEEDDDDSESFEGESKSKSK